MKKNFYINATILDERPTGLGVYVKNILVNIKKSKVGVKVFCPIDIEGFEVIKTTEKLKTSYKKKGGLYRFLWTQLVLPFKVSKNDVVYHPFQYLSILSRSKQIITIHDFIPLIYPEVAKHQYYYYKFIMPILLKKAHKIICISDNTKQDIIKFYKIDESKIHRIYNGYDKNLFNCNDIRDNVINKYNINKKYFISVGAGYSHKNLESSLMAFKEVCKKYDCEYVIIGKDSEYIMKLKELCNNLNIDGNVKFLGYVPDEDLPTLYNKSIAFVYPTLYEGFGLPILEAMACDTLVLSSNNSSLPEVYGDAAISFEALDINQIQESMEKALNDRSYIELLMAKSINQLEKFNWEDTTNQILDVICGE